MREDIKKRIEVVRAGKVPANYKRTDSGIMPEAWEDSAVGDIIEFHNEKSTINNEYPVLTSARSGLVLQTEYFEGQVTREENAGYNVMPYGYITYRSRSDDGRFTFNQNKVIGKGIVSCFYPVFRVKEESAVSEFVLSYLNNCLGRQIVKEIVGTSQLVLSEKKLSDLRMPCPPLTEQQKIAEILATCDQVIELKRQLLEEKRRQKQWLMQKLLSESSGVNEIPLADLCSTICDGDWIESKDQSESGIRLIQTGNVGVGRYLDKDGRARYISQETFERLHCTEVFPGDVLLSRLPDPIGRACMIPDLTARAITAVDCTILRFKEDAVAKFFLQYATSAEYFNKIAILAGGSTRTRISRKEIEKLSIPIPADVTTMKRISNGLSLADQEITMLEQELASWQQKKKALMQLLLTGLVRVNA